MADQPKVTIENNTREEVAFKLMKAIGYLEALDTREKLLDAYAECLATIVNPQGRVQETKQRQSR